MKVAKAQSSQLVTTTLANMFESQLRKLRSSDGRAYRSHRQMAADRGLVTIDGPNAVSAVVGYMSIERLFTPGSPLPGGESIAVVMLAMEFPLAVIEGVLQSTGRVAMLYIMSRMRAAGCTPKSPPPPV